MTDYGVGYDNLIVRHRDSGETAAVQVDRETDLVVRVLWLGAWQEGDPLPTVSDLWDVEDDLDISRRESRGALRGRGGPEVRLDRGAAVESAGEVNRQGGLSVPLSV